MIMIMILVIFVIITETGINFSLIDCSNVIYPANITRTVAIMKFCTGGEKEVK